MKTLSILWQRLVNESGQTCERCTVTGSTVENAYKKLKKSLVELGIEVELKKEILDFSIFIKDPLQSNRIWIAERPLEEWIGATVGKSQCCNVCGDSECRTISINQDTFENIPENLIIKAGLLAAAEIFK
ncbi:MAG: DUF2703 domain-containing protein [Deltaproteobacteria bacterium]|jgi:hypothetical protein|nr:DUF2703 domain-containing protein [Deltaproteobacteria bacterium]